MPAEPLRITTFRQRLRDKRHLLGTFVETPTTRATEILGSVKFDFIILDQEHAPLDRTTIDMMVLAARAVDMAALVRVGDGSPSSILSVLDCGATGVLVPHVDSPARAREIAASCRTAPARAASPTPRGPAASGAPACRATSPTRMRRSCAWR